MPLVGLDSCTDINKHTEHTGTHRYVCRAAQAITCSVCVVAHVLRNLPSLIYCLKKLAEAVGINSNISSLVEMD